MLGIHLSGLGIPLAGAETPLLETAVGAADGLSGVRQAYLLGLNTFSEECNGAIVGARGY
jgi:hypothetical protein